MSKFNNFLQPRWFSHLRMANLNISFDHVERISYQRVNFENDSGGDKLAYILFTFSGNLSHKNFQPLSDPSHWVMTSRASLGKEPTLYF